MSLSTSLSEAVEKLESEFWVSRDKLKQICARFQEELEQGLVENGRNIPMNVTWVQALPTGNEKGRFLTVDLGGTNLRVCWITLRGNGESDVEQKLFKVEDSIKTASADELWGFVADSLEAFLKEHDGELRRAEEEVIYLGFTFSYPATQERIDHGVLQTWTKGFDIEGVEDEDVADQLRKAMEARVCMPLCPIS
jgi:hexokinase